MSGRRVTSLAVAYAVLGVLPLFLVSAQSVQLQRDLGFDRAALGLAVSLCFAASALAANPAGRFVERVGPTGGLRLSASLSLLGLLVMAIVASAWWHVALAVALSGVANALAQVSTNVALASGVPTRRQGVAFGAKQAAIPTASLVAGLALPIVGLVAGWRFAFAGAALVVAVAVLRVPRLEGGAALRRSTASPERGTPLDDRRAAGRESESATAGDMPAHREGAPPGEARGGVRTRLLVLLAIAGLLAGAVGNAIPTFTVDSSVARGIDESLAGLLLAAGSLASIAGRIGSGWVADKRGSLGIAELATLTAIGALACSALALSHDSDALFAVAVIAGFGAGWGWAGVIYFAVVRTHPQAPAAATAFVLSVVFVGNVIGPAGVGFIAQHGSYELAWGVGAAVLALATAAALAARQASRPVAS
jgi:MFS family permease